MAKQEINWLLPYNDLKIWGLIDGHPSVNILPVPTIFIKDEKKLEEYVKDFFASTGDVSYQLIRFEGCDGKY